MKVGDYINTSKFNLHYDYLGNVEFIATIGQNEKKEYFCNIPSESIYMLYHLHNRIFWILQKYPTLLRITHIVLRSKDDLDIPFLEFADKDYLEKVQKWEDSGIFL